METSPEPTVGAGTFPDRLVLRDGQRMLTISVDEVVWVEAAGNYVQIYTPRKTHLVRHTVKAMEDKLDPERFVRVRPSAIVAVAVVKALNARAGGDYTVVLEDGGRSILSLRGELDDTAIDLRARPSGSRGWDLTLQVGLLGRGRPELSLLPEPGDDGHRPAHLLGRTHRAAGQVRQLELLDDALYDALLPFPEARVELWDAGSRVRLGTDLGGLDDERLARLLRELASRE